MGTRGGPPKGVLLELKDEKEANPEEPGLWDRGDYLCKGPDTDTV